MFRKMECVSMHESIVHVHTKYTNVHKTFHYFKVHTLMSEGLDDVLKA